MKPPRYFRSSAFAVHGARLVRIVDSLPVLVESLWLILLLLEEGDPSRAAGAPSWGLLLPGRCLGLSRGARVEREWKLSSGVAEIVLIGGFHHGGITDHLDCSYCAFMAGSSLRERLIADSILLRGEGAVFCAHVVVHIVPPYVGFTPCLKPSPYQRCTRPYSPWSEREWQGCLLR